MPVTIALKIFGPFSALQQMPFGTRSKAHFWGRAQGGTFTGGGKIQSMCCSKLNLTARSYI